MQFILACRLVIPVAAMLTPADDKIGDLPLSDRLLGNESRAPSIYKPGRENRELRPDFYYCLSDESLAGSLREIL